MWFDHRRAPLAYRSTAGSRAERWPPKILELWRAAPERAIVGCSLCLGKAQRLLAELAAWECKREVLPAWRCSPDWPPLPIPGHRAATDRDPVSESKKWNSVAGRAW